MNYNCRHCNTHLKHQVINLGNQPPSNAYLAPQSLEKPEVTYPLKVYLCEKCWLMQLPEHASAEKLFTEDYAYFSSTSTSWCKHAEEYVNTTVKNLGLNSESLVVELASNDGYLLQYMKNKNIPCFGVEPTKATAQSAIKKGIHTIQKFFGSKLAKELTSENKNRKADLIIANNVLAHVPDINDFLEGISILLKNDGMVSIEFPHLAELIKCNQFDTIYHEHYSYLSLSIVERISKHYGLKIHHVEKLKTHGGSLRVWLSHQEYGTSTKNVNDVLREEKELKLESLETYNGFQKRAERSKNNLIKFLINCYEEDNKIIGYGAAAKGNTMLNYAGIKSDLLPFVADNAPSKQGMYLPGSHIPIIKPDLLKDIRPYGILVLPWNLIKEISISLPDYKLITSIPDLKFW